MSTVHKVFFTVNFPLHVIITMMITDTSVIADSRTTTTTTAIMTVLPDWVFPVDPPALVLVVVGNNVVCSSVSTFLSLVIVMAGNVASEVFE